MDIGHNAPDDMILMLWNLVMSRLDRGLSGIVEKIRRIGDIYFINQFDRLRQLKI
jgi:hypothetical protein